MFFCAKTRDSTVLYSSTWRKCETPSGRKNLKISSLMLGVKIINKKEYYLDGMRLFRWRETVM